MKYHCPTCGVEMFESNFCNIYHCSRCVVSTEVKILDAIVAKDARIAYLENELNEARKEAKNMAFAANTMMQLLEHKDHPDAIAIMEKYK